MFKKSKKLRYIVNYGQEFLVKVAIHS